MAQSYADRFRKIMQIIAEDYAGQPECASKDEGRQWSAALAAAEEEKTLDDQLFMRFAAEYLAAFQDPNLMLRANEEEGYQPTTCGFSVRRFGDELFVTQVREDERFVPGDVLVLLDGKTLDEYLSHLIGNQVNGDDPERQLWDETLTRCERVQVRHADGTTEEVALAEFPERSLLESLDPPTFELRTNPETGEVAAILTFHHFVDYSALELLQQHAQEIVTAGRVVVDVRGVSEGMIGNAYGVVALFFDLETNLADLMGPHSVYSRYSENNTRLRLSQLTRIGKASDVTGALGLQEELEHVAQCEGRGFVNELEYEESLNFPPAPSHLYTFLLTDVHTRGVGEQMVAIAQTARDRGRGRACCVGRATRGGSDYANLLAESIDKKISLVYPMTKTAEAYHGEGILGCGLAPDAPIKFTPRECTEDLILATALTL
ncbi:MAG: hypothetical protein RR300_02405 [Raoultibacter sp.]